MTVGDCKRMQKVIYMWHFLHYREINSVKVFMYEKKYITLRRNLIG